MVRSSHEREMEHYCFPWVLWNTSDCTGRSVQGTLVGEDQSKPGDHLELLLAVDLACRGMRGAGKRNRSTAPLIPILIFVRTQALWVKKLICSQCDFPKHSLSHSNIWRWVIWEKRLKFKDKFWELWKAWYHWSLALLWHNLSRLGVNRVCCHS